MKALLLLVSLLLASGGADAQRHAAATYRISGVVVDAPTNAPVPNAQVSIFVGNEAISIVAGGDGRFTFEGLKAGKYALNATAQGYVREGYHQHGPFSTGIATGESQDSEHLVFPLHPQAVIYGRITDERGEAVRRAQVELFAADISRGSHTRFVQAQTQTNDLGEYRFAHLLPGKYHLAVQAHPWYGETQLTTQQIRDTRSAEGVAIGDRGGRQIVFDFVANKEFEPALDVVYPVTFYPGVTDERSSAELVLAAGEKEEADITMQAVPAAHLRVTVPPSEVGPSLGFGASQKAFGTFSFGLGVASGQISPGEYEVAGLPPGEVTLVVTTNNGNEWTSRTIEADTASGTIDASALPVTARVSGRVLLPGVDSEAKAGEGRLVSNTPGSMVLTSQLQKDGTFQFPAVQLGTYRVEVNLHIGGYFVQKVSAKEAKTSGREITIANGNDVDLTITLGQGLGRVTGVAQLDGKPAPGLMVLLVPESGQEMEENSRMDQSDSDGTFTLGGILPGNYILLAIKDGWDLEWAKPGVLQPYLSEGQKMSIIPNQSRNVMVSAQVKTRVAEKKAQ